MGSKESIEKRNTMKIILGNSEENIHLIKNSHGEMGEQQKKRRLKLDSTDKLFNSKDDPLELVTGKQSTKNQYDYYLRGYKKGEGNQKEQYNSQKKIHLIGSKLKREKSGGKNDGQKAKTSKQTKVRGFSAIKLRKHTKNSNFISPNLTLKDSAANNDRLQFAKSFEVPNTQDFSSLRDLVSLDLNSTQKSPYSGTVLDKIDLVMSPGLPQYNGKVRKIQKEAARISFFKDSLLKKHSQKARKSNAIKFEYLRSPKKFNHVDSSPVNRKSTFKSSSFRNNTQVYERKNRKINFIRNSSRKSIKRIHTIHEKSQLNLAKHYSGGRADAPTLQDTIQKLRNEQSYSFRASELFSDKVKPYQHKRNYTMDNEYELTREPKQYESNKRPTSRNYRADLDTLKTPKEEEHSLAALMKIQKKMDIAYQRKSRLTNYQKNLKNSSLSRKSNKLPMNKNKPISKMRLFSGTKTLKLNEDANKYQNNISKKSYSPSSFTLVHSALDRPYNSKDPFSIGSDMGRIKNSVGQKYSSQKKKRARDFDQEKRKKKVLTKYESKLISSMKEKGSKMTSRMSLSGLSRKLSNENDTTFQKKSLLQHRKSNNVTPPILQELNSNLKSPIQMSNLSSKSIEIPKIDLSKAILEKNSSNFDKLEEANRGADYISNDLTNVSSPVQVRARPKTQYHSFLKSSQLSLFQKNESKMEGILSQKGFSVTQNSPNNAHLGKSPHQLNSQNKNSTTKKSASRLSSGKYSMTHKAMKLLNRKLEFLNSFIVSHANYTKLSNVSKSNINTPRDSGTRKSLINELAEWSVGREHSVSAKSKLNQNSKYTYDRNYEYSATHNKSKPHLKVQSYRSGKRSEGLNTLKNILSGKKNSLVKSKTPRVEISKKAGSFVNSHVGSVNKLSSKVKRISVSPGDKFKNRASSGRYTPGHVEKSPSITSKNKKWLTIIKSGLTSAKKELQSFARKKKPESQKSQKLKLKKGKIQKSRKRLSNSPQYDHPGKKKRSKTKLRKAEESKEDLFSEKSNSYMTQKFAIVNGKVKPLNQYRPLNSKEKSKKINYKNTNSLKQSLKNSITESGFNLKQSRMNTEPDDDDEMSQYAELVNQKYSQTAGSGKGFFKNRRSFGKNKLKLKGSKKYSQSFLNIAMELSVSPRLAKNSNSKLNKLNKLKNHKSEEKSQLVNSYIASRKRRESKLGHSDGHFELRNGDPYQSQLSKSEHKLSLRSSLARAKTFLQNPRDTQSSKKASSKTKIGERISRLDKLNKKKETKKSQESLQPFTQTTMKTGKSSSKIMINPKNNLSKDKKRYSLCYKKNQTLSKVLKEFQHQQNGNTEEMQPLEPEAQLEKDRKLFKSPILTQKNIQSITQGHIEEEIEKELEESLSGASSCRSKDAEIESISTFDKLSKSKFKSNSNLNLKSSSYDSSADKQSRGSQPLLDAGDIDMELESHENLDDGEVDRASSPQITQFRSDINDFKSPKEKPQNVSSQHDCPEILKSHYKLLGIKLGEGAHAEVHLAQNLITKQKVAVKIYDKRKLQNPVKMENVMNEIDILQTVNNQYIVQFIKKYETPDSIQVAMEYGGRKNLREYVEDERITQMPQIEEVPEGEEPPIPICIGLDAQVAIGLYKQVVQAICHLHDLEIVHRDLKLENIVLDDHGKLNIKLVDFGFARKDLGQPIRSDICGTPNYMSPELHRRDPHISRPTDIWASGVIFFYLLTGFFPFGGKDEEELSSSICSEDPLFEILGPKSRNVIVHLLKGVLDKDPESRWDIYQVVHYLNTFTQVFKVEQDK